MIEWGQSTRSNNPDVRLLIIPVSFLLISGLTFLALGQQIEIPNTFAEAVRC